MSVTIYRTVPTGTINPEQLSFELNAADITTVCEAIGLLVGAPNDTLELVFVAAPDETEVDAVIAAHPSYTFGIASPVSFTADIWETIYSLPLASQGEWVHLDAEISLQIGDETDMQVSTIYVDTNAKRFRGSSSALVLSGRGGSVDEYGDVPLAEGRMIADGFFIRFQLRIGVTASATVEGEVNKREGKVFP